MLSPTTYQTRRRISSLPYPPGRAEIFLNASMSFCSSAFATTLSRPVVHGKVIGGIVRPFSGMGKGVCLLVDEGGEARRRRKADISCTSSEQAI